MSCPKYNSETEGRNYLEAYLNAVKPEPMEDVERAIIQCLLADSSCIKETTILLPEMFADKLNREIFISIKELAEALSTVDVSTISANFRQRNIDVEENELTEYLEKLHPIGTANITSYVKILNYQYLQLLFYDLMSLAPLALGKKANINNFYDFIKPALTPINRALFDTFDGQFVPHWVTNGITSYKVLKSKFDQGGYVWVGKVAVKEADLLACGYQKVFKDPGSPIK